MTTDTKELRAMPVVTVEQVNRFRNEAIGQVVGLNAQLDIANEEIDTLTKQVATLREALIEARDHIQVKAAKRGYCVGATLATIDKALAASAPAAQEQEKPE